MLWKRNGDFLKRNAIIALANNPSSDTKEVFINLLKDSGYPGIKIEKKIDFEQLYNQRSS